jgi:hypothetical protein
VSVPCFLLFLCFRKVTQEIFSELDETKTEPPIFTEALRRPKMRWRGARSQAHHRGAWPNPWPRRPMVRPAGPTSDDALSPMKSPQREKPKGRISFLWNILRAAAVAVARSGGSRSSSRYPAGGLLHHHGRLRSDVWVVYLGLWFHSSSKMAVSSTMRFMFRSCELPYMIRIIFM